MTERNIFTPRYILKIFVPQTESIWTSFFEKREVCNIFIAKLTSRPLQDQDLTKLASHRVHRIHRRQIASASGALHISVYYVTTHDSLDPNRNGWLKTFWGFFFLVQVLIRSRCRTRKISGTPTSISLETILSVFPVGSGRVLKCPGQCRALRIHALSYSSVIKYNVVFF